MSAARATHEPLRASLARSPTFPLALGGIAVALWLGNANAGFDGTTWYPAGLIMLALLGLAVAAARVRRPPAPIMVSIAALAAYAAWSYLSIGWADQAADAWDGANRTLLYVLVFALFAVGRVRARPAALLLGIFCIGVGVTGLVVLLRAAAAGDPAQFFLSGRLASPSGYQNANAALWTLAVWPCVALGARRELRPLMRAALVASAVLLAGLALLGQSRGWLFTAPLGATVFILLVRDRLRASLTLLLVAVAVAVAAPTLLDLYPLEGRPAFAGGVSDAARALILAAGIAGSIAAVAAVLDTRARVSVTVARRAGRALAAAAATALVVALCLFVAIEGSPFTALANGWRDFKSQPDVKAGSSRFGGSLGSNRYDFWRVAWGRFEHAPLVGIGADNFQEAYLARRRSYEEPRYPHSIELRTLSQTGIVGALLLGAGLVPAIWAALMAVRRRRGLGSAVAAGALASFAYWLLHGSVDWFWELPALGLAAFAMLGLAAGLLPRAPARPPRRARLPIGAAPATALVVALAIAISFTLPWLSLLETRRATESWAANPALAFKRLDRASSLNPLSYLPSLFAGSIALRLGQDRQAASYFRDAIAREPGDAYSNLELGLILSRRHSPAARREAVAALRRAVALNPRDRLPAAALAAVRRGERVDIAALNRKLARRSAERGQ